MSVGILLIFESALVTAFGVVMQVVVIDVYPQIWGIHIAFYIFAGLLVAYGIIDMIRFQKRRKRRILRGQLKRDGINLVNPIQKVQKTPLVRAYMEGNSKNSDKKVVELNTNKKPVKSIIYWGQSKNKR